MTVRAGTFSRLRYIFFVFLPRDAMLNRGLYRHAVSVRLSVSLAKRHSNIPTGTPLTGASNAGGLGGNRDSEPISG